MHDQPPGAGELFSSLISARPASIVEAFARGSQACVNLIILRGEHLIVAALINDRSAIAWLIVGGYFSAAIFALVASRSARQRERRFWLCTGVLLIVLGLNKELDLQSVLTTAGRDFARQLGWYEQRRLMQGIFLLITAAGALAVVGALAAWLRRSSGPVKAAAMGIVTLFAFIVMRAASFHHVDHWVTIDVAGLRSGWWLELLGVGVIGLSALTYRSRRT